ncbi:focadhesin isoform X2 [Pararge aegeria]|uniref:focadhesin isoform X2 n=1 Tax=Pararge aegeria TaxID=116150 RepID=UPI0019D057D4|nr:focadhesin isoform X2 [Pararge aegeria]
MDEIEYKLKTNNSVLIVNAIDKLLSTIKVKYKVGERQKFVIENEELKYLREKCSAPEHMVSLTACQGLLALVELGVLEIGHTMSTVITLLPTTHNYSAIISTMAGLLVLDLKSRLIPGQPYKCQFSLRSPRHPFISVLEKNKEMEDDVLAKMHALCTHPEYTVASNSLELLRPVFLWLTCSPHRSSIKPWQLLLSLPYTDAQFQLLIACISCQKICSSKQIEYAFAAYSAVTDAAIYQARREHVVAFIPVLARICGELVTHGRDPRGCYKLIERCFALDTPELKSVAGLTLMLLADNLTNTSALYLHELFNLCLNIVSKYEYSKICLSSFVGLSLQWIHLPSYLTNNALSVASKILDTFQNDQKHDTGLYMANLKSNATFIELAHSDKSLYVYFKLSETWERLRDDPDKLRSWFDVLTSVNDQLKLEMLTFFVGVVMYAEGGEDLTLTGLRAIIDLVRVKKEVSVTVLPVLLYKMANDTRPSVKLECLRGLPLMATTKENVPALVSILNKLKANKGVPTSLLIMLYTRLAETQVRCFPYLQELLVDSGVGRPDDLKWEVDVAKAVAVKRICELRASSHGLELVAVISAILNRCTERAGAAPTALVLDALASLWRANAVAPPSTWRALAPRLGRDSRPRVQISLCKLLAEIPPLRVSTPEYDKLIRDAARKLWQYIAESNQPSVIEAACNALAEFKVDDYKLKDIPEIYRRTVKLPPAYCKTPLDAVRKPEDVLDYVPCEVWPELFKYTNQSALNGVHQLVTKLMEREIKGYRSGVYQVEAREPQSLGHMPATSVVRGMMECFRKQVTSPSYDYPDSALLAILEALTEDFPKPLPPMDLCFLHEVFHRGSLWKAGCVKLAARQAHTSGSAKRLIENFLQGVGSSNTGSEEAEIMLFFDNLQILCRTMAPNNLRQPLEICLGDSFAEMPRIKPKDLDLEELLFIKQLKMVKQCLESDKIHDANRTLLSQIVENYFSVVNDDHLAWPLYVETCRALSTKYLERMTSPTGWWEVTSELLRKSSAVRSRLACLSDVTAPLVWLNESIDAHASSITEQEYSLRCMFPALQRADIGGKATREWFQQLLARTQVAFNETDDEMSKLYLCDVFFLTVTVFSGHWALEPDADVLAKSGAARRALLPAATAFLMSRDGWKDCTAQWLCHTRDLTKHPETARGCHRAMLALRHSDQFTSQGVWTRIETNFCNTTINLDY